MHIGLIADTFPPHRTSAAVQLRDLAREISSQGHNLTVIIPCPDISQNFKICQIESYECIRLKAPPIKELGYMKRTFNEIIMPWSMIYNFKKVNTSTLHLDGLVWYSPSIFHGPFIYFLKKKYQCKSYLILRDIFPEWALDLGLMSRGLPYFFFKLVAYFQYSVANTIGVQSEGNLVYFNEWKKGYGRDLKILPNWISKQVIRPCIIRIEKTPLVGRKILVYAGNMGIAQGMDILLDLAERKLSRSDVGFLFVGRGSEVERLKRRAINSKLTNVFFSDEIHPDEISELYSQCDIGLVGLSSKHKSHNIPGKFLTYMQNGLPCLANINPGNDLSKLIKSNKVGRVCESNDIDDLSRLMDDLLFDLEDDDEISIRCKNLYQEKYTVKNIVEKIIETYS